MFKLDEESYRNLIRMETEDGESLFRARLKCRLMFEGQTVWDAHPTFGLLLRLIQVYIKCLLHRT